MADDGEPARFDGRRVALVLATSTGGVGQHVRSLAAGLVARGARVAVVGPADTETRFAFTDVGVSFAAVEISTGPRPIADAFCVSRLRDLLRHADVVHAHGLRAGLLTGMALGVPLPVPGKPRGGPARARGLAGRPRPCVVTWHNALLPTEGAAHGGPAAMPRGGRNETKARLLALTGKGVRSLTARMADVTIGASPDLVVTARACGAPDARFVPVAAPPSAPPTRTREDVRGELGAGERPIVLAIGRLGPQKDYPTLLDAATRWTQSPSQPGSDQGTDNEVPLFVIVGDGPLAQDIADRVRAEDLPVRLLGYRSDVTELLLAADVVVLPSLWEARSLVAQDALRLARPLVATAVGGMPELVGDAGILVPPRAPVALADAVGGLLNDPGEAARLGEAALARAETLPTEDHTIDEIGAIYRELLVSPSR